MSEVLSKPDKSDWLNAMSEEMKSLHANDVWDLVELPEGRKAVGSKWVYKLKVDADGVVERHKARLVAQDSVWTMTRHFVQLSDMNRFVH